MKRLELDVFTSADFDEEILRPLGRLTALEKAALYLGPERISRKFVPAPEISGRTLAVLAASSRLETLTVGGTRLKALTLKPARFGEVRPSGTLKSVTLSRLVLDEENLAWIAGATGLTKLHITNSTIDDNAMAHLAGLYDLESLDMTGTGGFGDDGIRHLTGLRNLKRFISWSQDVTDAGAQVLALMDSLETLSLVRSGITDEGVRALADNSNVSTLNLSSCANVTDAMLEDLPRFRVLKSVTLWNTSKITCAAVNDLRDRVSELESELTVIRPAPRGRD